MLTLRFKPPRIYYDDGGLSTPRLYRVDGDARTEVPLTMTTLMDGNVLLAPVSAPEVGTKLTLEAEPGCFAPGSLRADYVVTSAVAVPAALGTLQATLKRGLLRGGAPGLAGPYTLVVRVGRPRADHAP